mgnify:CR=1 FL=1
MGLKDSSLAQRRVPGVDIRARVTVLGEGPRGTPLASGIVALDQLLHQAALGSVPRSMTDPVGSHNSNVTGFLNMLLAARDAGARRFVFASSSAVYGDSPELPKREGREGGFAPFALFRVVRVPGSFARFVSRPT